MIDTYVALACVVVGGPMVATTFLVIVVANLIETWGDER